MVIYYLITRRAALPHGSPDLLTADLGFIIHRRRGLSPTSSFRGASKTANPESGSDERQRQTSSRFRIGARRARPE
jgi:hypothetical protein